MRFDELEAHLVELRATKDPVTAKLLRTYLQTTLAREKKLVDRLFDKIGSMSMIEAMALVRWPYSSEAPLNHAFDISLGEKESIRVVGSILAFRSRPPERSEMRQVLLDTIDQFDARIEEIETVLRF